MGGACGTYGGTEMCAQGFGGEAETVIFQKMPIWFFPHNCPRLNKIYSLPLVNQRA